jgi:drug/metabolite transporter (DMT)-like permease
MNVGLLYTPVSIYQMTRGALVLFVGILSVIFLHRRLWLYQFSCYVLVLVVLFLIAVPDGYPWLLSWQACPWLVSAALS